MRPGRPILWFERSYGSLVSKIRFLKFGSEIRSAGGRTARAGCSVCSHGSADRLVRDITTIAGVRDNPLVATAIVVGLNGTGDRQQTLFTTQTLANVMQRMGVQIPANSVIVKNVAAVFVTASLPPFARPGMAAGRHRLLHRRRQEPRRRSAAAGPVARARWPGLCRSARATHAGRIHGWKLGQWQAIKPSDRGTYPERRNRGAGHCHRPESPEHRFAGTAQC